MPPAIQSSAPWVDHRAPRPAAACADHRRQPRRPAARRRPYQAAGMAEWLARGSIDRIYCSPMRARENAAPLATRLSLEPILEAGIAEFDQHADSYVPMEEIKRTDPQRWRALVESGCNMASSTRRSSAPPNRRSVRRIIARQPRRPRRDRLPRRHRAWAARPPNITRHLFFALHQHHRFAASSRGYRSFTLALTSASPRAVSGDGAKPDLEIDAQLVRCCATFTPDLSGYRW